MLQKIETGYKQFKQFHVFHQIFRRYCLRRLTSVKSIIIQLGGSNSSSGHQPSQQVSVESVFSNNKTATDFRQTLF